MLPSSGKIPINSLSFPLVDPTLRLQLHRKRDNIVVILAVVLAVIAWSDDLLSAHGTFRDAFARLRTLVFTGYEGFHEACMAE